MSRTFSVPAVSDNFVRRWVHTGTNEDVTTVALAPAVRSRFLSRDDIHVNTPDANGFRAPSPYWWDSIEDDGISGTAFSTTVTAQWSPSTGTRWGEDRYDWFGSLGPSNLVAPPASTGMRAIVHNKAVLALKSKLVDLSVSLAELSPTVSMIGKGAERLDRMLGFALRKDWKSAARVVNVHLTDKHAKLLRKKSLANGLLEIQYGWSPLVTDVVGLSESLARGLLEIARLVYGRASFNSSYSAVESGSVYAPQGDVRFRLKTRNDTQGFCREVVIARVDSPAFFAASQFGLTNPVSTAWELTTLSFVADWFVSIGDFLDTLDLPFAVDYLGGSSTEGFRISCKTSGFPDWCSSSAHMPMLRGAVSGSARRYIGNRVIVPSLVGRLDVTNPFSVGKVVTSCALVAQRWPRR